MYGNKKRAESPSATATIVIGESKALDLSSLLGAKKNGVTFNNNKSNGSTSSPKIPNVQVKPEHSKNGTSTPIFSSKVSKVSTSSSHSSRSPSVHSRAESSTSNFTSSHSSNTQTKANDSLDFYANNEHLKALLEKASRNSNSAVQSRANQLLSFLNNAKKAQPTWNTRHCFSENYLYFKDNKITAREYGESGVQFKCTYKNCGKRVSTNINFMYHVMAHIKRLHFKSSQNGSLYNIVFGIGDLGKAVAEKPMLHCVECLAEFTSTQKLLNHQFFVHRYRLQSNANNHPVCNICEKEVDLNNAEKHADTHGEYELPFDCPSCSFRSSSRQSLLFHIERCHNASTTLICPFCLEKFPTKKPSTTKVERERIILTSSNYVEHLLEHFQDGVRKSNCSRCSLKFCADTYQDLTEKIKLHNEMHKSASKLRLERKSLADLFAANPNQREAEVKALSPSCTDCGYRIKTLDSHYRKRQACENENCTFETRCKIGFKQHAVLCPLKDPSVSRLPFGKSSLSRELLMNSFNKERMRLRCNLCFFSTKDSAVFNDHLSKECIGARNKCEETPNSMSSTKRELTADEKRETELFGVDLDKKRFKHHQFEGFLEDSKKQTKWLSKVIPFIADKNLSVFKKSSIVTSVSIADQTGSSATNDYFDITKFFCEEDQDAKQLENAKKIAEKLFPPSRFPSRKM